MVAIAEDGDGVGDLGEFVKAMGDVDDGYAALGEAADYAEEHLGFVTGEGGSGFIEHQDGGVEGHCLGDLDDLLLCYAETGGFLVDVEIDAHFCEDFAGAATGGGPVEHEGGDAGFLRDSAEKDVFGDGQFGDDAEFLVDGGDAVAEGVGGGIEFDGLAVHGDLAVSGLDRSGEDFDESAFAGSVFTQ